MPRAHELTTQRQQQSFPRPRRATQRNHPTFPRPRKAGNLTPGLLQGSLIGDSWRELQEKMRVPCAAAFWLFAMVAGQRLRGTYALTPTV